MRGRGRALIALIVAVAMLVTMTGGLGGAGKGDAAVYAATTQRVSTIADLVAALARAKVTPDMTIIIDGPINEVKKETLELPAGATLEIGNGGSLALVAGGDVAGPDPVGGQSQGPAFSIKGKIRINSGGKIDWSNADSRANGRVTIAATGVIELNGGTFKLPNTAGNVFPVKPDAGALLYYRGGETSFVSVKVDPVDGLYKELSLIDKKVSTQSPYLYMGAAPGWVQTAKTSGGAAVSEVAAVFATEPADGVVAKIKEAIQAGIDHINASLDYVKYHGGSAPQNNRIEIDARGGPASPEVLLRFDGAMNSIVTAANSAKVTTLLLKTNRGVIELTPQALQNIATKAGAENFRMRIAPGTPDAANKGLYTSFTEVTFTFGNSRTPIGDIDGGVTLTLPYDCGDPANASTVKFYRLSGSSVKNIAGVAYDAATKTVRFKTKDFGTFASKQNYTVYFDPQNGSNRIKTSVPAGAPVGTLTKAPTRAGYDFAGWYTAASGGASVSEDTAVAGDATYYAHWTPLGYTVTFKDGATTVKTLNLPYDSTLGTLPARSKTGHTFSGWYTAAKGGTKVSSSTRVVSNATYYAQWVAKQYKVTLNANGGKVSGKKTKVITKKYGTAISSLTKAKRKGWTFDGWYTKRNGGSLVKKVTVKKNVTYYAHWVRTGKIVNASTVNLRAKPSQSASVKAKIKRGKTVTYLGKSGSWYKVRYGKKVGYIHKKYVKF